MNQIHVLFGFETFSGPDLQVRHEKLVYTGVSYPASRVSKIFLHCRSICRRDSARRVGVSRLLVKKN